ncbi:Dipeptidyl aminopeptidase [Phaffia rhodozyma]|uniref:acylaminoacyl-peptidase n=1 Tax=Phaffia rhodozyma TaxID=264483 RepID=A0A0F7SFD8_PHARH|nr:Dipeptidyl aminopeptidase [Phaffia rhodozyma]
MDSEPRPNLSAYKLLAELPTFKSGQFFTPDYLHLTTQVRSHVYNTRITQVKTVQVPFESSKGLNVPSVDLPKGTIEIFSDDGFWRACFKVDTVDGKERRVLELWDVRTGRRNAERILTDICGDFLSDETWGPPRLYYDETQTDTGILSLVFTAHRLSPSQTSDLSPFDQHKFTPTWGELNAKNTFPTIFYCSANISPKTEISLNVVPVVSASLDETISFGQPVLAMMNGERKLVLATGYGTMEDGRRLGIVYCTNRRAEIWTIPVPPPPSSGSLTSTYEGASLSDMTRISGSDRSARSPRVLDRSKVNKPDILVYLSNPLGGAHNSCASLHLQHLSNLSLISKTEKEERDDDDVLVGPVWDPESKDAFPGLYVQALPAFPFLNTNEPFIVLTSIKRSRSTVYAIPLDVSGKGIRSNPVELTREGLNSWSVLGTDAETRVCLVRSGLMDPQEVVVGQITPDDEGDLELQILNGVEGGFKLDSDARVDIIKLTHPVETIRFRPSSNSTQSSGIRLLSIHGGPHSTTTTAFSPLAAALVQEGYEIYLVNYTGSLGYGEKWAQALVGECGQMDIRDCWEAVERMLGDAQAEGETKPKIGIMGGSHGGFLTAHLTSKYPDAFHAAILRNPVISLGENAGTSDIPDWVYAELGLPFSLSSKDDRPQTTPTVDQYKFLQSRSPIGNAHNVKAPSLILMGDSDQRVPPSQTKGWYHALRSRSHQIKTYNRTLLEEDRIPELAVECLVFKGEGHALDGVKAELASAEATFAWFKKYLA